MCLGACQKTIALRLQGQGATDRHMRVENELYPSVHGTTGRAAGLRYGRATVHKMGEDDDGLTVPRRSAFFGPAIVTKETLT